MPGSKSHQHFAVCLAALQSGLLEQRPGSSGLAAIPGSRRIEQQIQLQFFSLGFAWNFSEYRLAASDAIQNPQLALKVAPQHVIVPTILPNSGTFR
jgi:hypothetical protein